MKLLRILLTLGLMLPVVPAWPCEPGEAPATESANQPIGHATAHQPPHQAAHQPPHASVAAGSHHGHPALTPAEVSSAEKVGKAVHDCCASQDTSSSCLTSPGCGQSAGASLLPVAAHSIAVPALKDRGPVRFTTALLPSHALPPFRPPSV